MRLCFGGDEPTLAEYSDPFIVGDIDSKMSTSCYIIKFAGRAMTWKFILQKYIELSTLESEFIDVTEACKELIWLKKFLQKLGFVEDKYVLFADSKSVLHLGKDPTFHKRFMHFDVRYHWIRDVLDSKLLEFAEVYIDDNGYDMMIKALPRGKFEIPPHSCEGEICWVLGSLPMWRKVQIC